LRSRLVPEDRLKVSDLSSEVNLGAALPTGSVKTTL
jgi:hypothetical protein